MTKCNTNQLLDTHLEVYLTARRQEISTALDRVVRAISTPGNDTQDNRDHRQALIGRACELDTLRQRLEEEETARRQRDLDNFEEQMTSDIDLEPRQSILERYEVDSETGRVVSRGKFEGEMIYAVYYYDWMLNGEGETMQDDDGNDYTVFDVAPEDRQLFPEIPNSIYKVALTESESGFVYLSDNATPGFSTLGTDEDRENRAEAAQAAQDDETPSIELEGTIMDPSL